MQKKYIIYIFVLKYTEWQSRREFRPANCFEHKDLVYGILLMKYEDFMAFLHLKNRWCRFFIGAELYII